MIDIRHTIRHTTHSVSMSLDGDTGNWAHQRANGIMFRPRYLRLLWRWVPTEGWSLRSAEASGPNVRADGGFSTRFSSRDFALDGHLADDKPEWLGELIEGHAPSGVVLTP